MGDRDTCLIGGIKGPYTGLIGLARLGLGFQFLASKYFETQTLNPEP